MRARGLRASPISLIVHPTWRFFHFYVLKLGFLAGWRGLLQASMAAHYVRMKYAKLLEAQLLAKTRPPE